MTIRYSKPKRKHPPLILGAQEAKRGYLLFYHVLAGRGFSGTPFNQIINRLRCRSGVPMGIASLPRTWSWHEGLRSWKTSSTSWIMGSRARSPAKCSVPADLGLSSLRPDWSF